VYGGHSLVNCPTTCGPTQNVSRGCWDWNGFGFSGNTRNVRGTAWTCGATGGIMTLFTASMVVALGDGKTAQF
jgi:hypothetical protein